MRLETPVRISYKCKNCKQEAPYPPVTDTNWDKPTWHDCSNNVWMKEDRPQEMAEVA